MKENDVKFFKGIAVVACLILIVGVALYTGKNYHYVSHQEKLDQQAKEMKDAIDSVNDAIARGDTKQFNKK